MSRAKGSKRYKEDKWELDQSKSLAKEKAIQSKNQNEDDLQVPPQLWVSLVMDKEYVDISRWYRNDIQDQLQNK